MIHLAFVEKLLNSELLQSHLQENSVIKHKNKTIGIVSFEIVSKSK
jgi:hypothetical protein